MCRIDVAVCECIEDARSLTVAARLVRQFTIDGTLRSCQIV